MGLAMRPTKKKKKTGKKKKKKNDAAASSIPEDARSEKELKGLIHAIKVIRYGAFRKQTSFASFTMSYYKSEANIQSNARSNIKRRGAVQRILILDYMLGAIDV